MYDIHTLNEFIQNNELNKALVYLKDSNEQYSYIKKAEIYLILGLLDRFQKSIDIDFIIDESFFSINFLYIYYSLYEYDEGKRSLYEKSFKENLYKLSSYELKIEMKLIDYVNTKLNWQLHQIRYESITSTNDVFKELVKEDGNLKVLVADEQVSGKGQKERKFFSPKGGLYISIKVNPQIEDIYYVTAYAGISAIEACYKVSGKHMDIKWINDLYYNDKKVSGILTESKFTPEGKMDYAIIGIGINLIKNKDVPSEFHDIYGYLLEEYKDYNTNDLIENVKYYLIPDLIKLEDGIDIRLLIDSYNERLYKKDKEVKIYNKDTTNIGKLVGVDDNLDIILDKNGKLYKYKYGDYRMKI